MASNSHVYKQGNCNKIRGLELVNFLLNQPAGNKASSCNLLRASARCRPGNTYCQRLRKHNPSLFTFYSSAGVPMSIFFLWFQKAGDQAAKTLSFTPWFTMQWASIGPFTCTPCKCCPALLACSNRRPHPINFKQLQFLAKHLMTEKNTIT